MAVPHRYNSRQKRKRRRSLFSSCYTDGEGHRLVGAGGLPRHLLRLLEGRGRRSVVHLAAIFFPVTTLPVKEILSGA